MSSYTVEDALVDVTRALCENGEAGVIEWLSANLIGQSFDMVMARETLEDYRKATGK